MIICFEKENENKINIELNYVYGDSTLQLINIGQLNLNAVVRSFLIMSIQVVQKRSPCQKWSLIHVMLNDERRVTKREMAEAAVIFIEHYILHTYLVHCSLPALLSVVNQRDLLIISK